MLNPKMKPFLHTDKRKKKGKFKKENQVKD